MAVNLINSSDTTITKTNDNIQVDFSSSRNTQITTIETSVTDLQTNQGTLSNLETTDKTNLVGAINEIISNIEGTTTPITWSSGITEISNTENSIRINSIEKSCVLTFAVDRSSAIETAFVLGTFNSNYAPSNLVIGVGIVSSAGPSTNACQVSIDSSGNININNKGHSSSTFRGQIKWYYE